MPTLASSCRVLAATPPVGVHGGFDDLVALARERFGEDPFTGDPFCSFDRRRERIEVLVWDRNDAWPHLHETRAQHPRAHRRRW